jgi:uncharacterized protein (UPF0216 family)
VTWYWLLCNLMIISGSDFQQVSQKHELLFIFSLLKHQLKSNEKMILTMELQQLVQRQVLEKGWIELEVQEVLGFEQVEGVLLQMPKINQH